MEVKERHFVNLQGWMVTKLGLGGNELLVYSVIYGFTQKEGHEYTGGVPYLQEWLDTKSRNTVTTILEKLEEKGLIIKTKKGHKNCYYINTDILDDDESRNIPDSSENESSNIQDSTPEKIQNDSRKNREYYNNKAKDILSYLNEKSSKGYNILDPNNQKGIKKLLRQGYEVEDLIKVIDYKWKVWGAKPYVFSSGTVSSTMIDPKILFGHNFDRYITEANSNPKALYGNSVSRPVDTDVTDEVY